MFYVRDGAKCMCTGCPGVPGRLKASKARTVKLKGGTKATEKDKKIHQPGFGMCLAIPTAPRKCNPKLATWVNVQRNVKDKGKSALLYPNAIPCMFGPGLVTLITKGYV